MNAVDVSFGSKDVQVAARCLEALNRYHGEKKRFCNADKYDMKNDEHEKMLKTVSQ